MLRSIRQQHGAHNPEQKQWPSLWQPSIWWVISSLLPSSAWFEVYKMQVPFRNHCLWFRLCEKMSGCLLCFSLFSGRAVHDMALKNSNWNWISVHKKEGLLLLYSTVLVVNCHAWGRCGVKLLQSFPHSLNNHFIPSFVVSSQSLFLL